MKTFPLRLSSFCFFFFVLGKKANWKRDVALGIVSRPFLHATNFINDCPREKQWYVYMYLGHRAGRKSSHHH